MFSTEKIRQESDNYVNKVEKNLHSIDRADCARYWRGEMLYVINLLMKEGASANSLSNKKTLWEE